MRLVRDVLSVTGIWTGRRTFKLLSVIFLATTLSGCALLTPPKPPPETFDLSAPRDFPGLRSGTRAQILIKAPSALKALDSQGIVVKPTAAVITYLAGAQWSDSLPKMLQIKLVETFENTGRAAAMAIPGDGLVIDYQVLTSIRAFEVVVGGGAKYAIVELSVRLLNDRTGKVLRARVFQATTAFAGSGNDDYIAALDATFDKVAREIVVWVLSRV